MQSPGEGWAARVLSPATSEATGTDRARLGAFEQQRALGELTDLDEGRKKIGDSFPLSLYEA